MDYFNTLEPLLRTFWYIAIPVSAIFAIQTIMTFLGSDAADGLDADFDGDLEHGDEPFQLFTFRNLINFLLGLSWTGISLYNTIPNRTILVALSLGVGMAFITLFFMIIKQLQKLAEDNTFKIESTLKKTATVYLRIPASRTGNGKVQISINGAFRELDAVTNGDSIESGASVLIVNIVNQNLVQVERI
ncbi:hypothetical protein [Pedobacter sp. GR22-6]|uniref:hypothetical protein n=1 Tax=Pedobacter sp. GR22-6 TaxID=3127957 RepID=UPI00307D3EFE